MRKLIVAHLLLLFIILTNTLNAQSTSDADKEKKLPVFDMGKIEVVGEAPAIEPAAVTRVTSDESDQKLHESVTDVMNGIPGLHVTVGSKNEPQVMMRGFIQGRTLILYDGVPMAAPYYSDVDTSEIPLDNLAECAVVRGNASVLYGSNAMAGVVSLTSARPEKTNVRALFSMDQEANYFSRLTHGATWNNLYYQVSAGLRHSDGWRMSDDFQTTRDKYDNELENGDIRNHSAYDQWSAGLKVGKVWDTGEVSLSGSYLDASKEIPPSTSPLSKTSYWDFPTWRKYSTILVARTQLTEALDFRTNLFFHKYDNVLRNYNDPEYQSVRWESTFDDFSTGMNARLAWTALDAFTLRSTLNGLIDHHRAQSDVGEPWEAYEARTYSAATEGEWIPADDVTLQLGVGYEIYDFASADNIEVADGAVQNRTHDVNALTYSVLGEYRVTDFHTFTAGISQKNRFPNMHQLFSNIDLFQPEEIPSLDTETAMQYSLGWSCQPTRYVFGITGYYYDVENLIQRPNRDALYDNMDVAEFKGLEAWGELKQDEGIIGKIAFTHQNATGNQDGEKDQDLPLVPDNILNIDLGYRFAFGTELSAGYEFNDTSVEYFSGPAEEIPSVSLWSLSVRHDFRTGLSLSVQGTNLLDENYYREIGFEQPGRTIRFSVQYVL